MNCFFHWDWRKGIGEIDGVWLVANGRWLGGGLVRLDRMDGEYI
jgi:hypothetical protein